MLSRFKLYVLTALAALFLAAPAFSQVVFTQGVVKNPDGTIVQGAIVAFDRLDMANHLEAKTDKKGHYIMGMKPATYSVTVTVDGKVRQKMNQFEAGASPDALDITLKPVPAAGAPAAAQTLSAAPAAKGDPAADKDKEKAAKDREAQLAKNKELNDSFGAGKAAIDNKNWDEAITQLTKASELGPTQIAVWAALAEAYTGSAKATRSKADAGPIYDKAFAAYDKLITLTPDDAGAYNNYALAMAADGKLDDAKIKLAKAVELDPPGAGKYHYNLGALLMNGSQTDGALDEFRKAIAADPNYAEAYYYLGSTMVGKATLDQATGKMIAPDGTIQALQKYLELKPDGPNAQSAKELITALGSAVQVNYKDPNAPAKSNKKSK